MPRYTFSLDHADVKNPLSLVDDTNYCVASLSVNGQMIGQPQTKFIASQGKGTMPINFIWPSVDVPATEATVVSLWYGIVNRGGERDNKLIESMTTNAAAKAAMGAPVSAFGAVGGAIAGTAAEVLKDVVKDFLSHRCDGPITPDDGRLLQWHTFELAPIASGTNYKEAVEERGTSSPTGCGDNSHYTVHFTVAAL